MSSPSSLFAGANSHEKNLILYSGLHDLLLKEPDCNRVAYKYLIAGDLFITSQSRQRRQSLYTDLEATEPLSLSNDYKNKIFPFQITVSSYSYLLVTIIKYLEGVSEDLGYFSKIIENELKGIKIAKENPQKQLEKPSESSSVHPIKRNGSIFVLSEYNNVPMMDIIADKIIGIPTQDVSFSSFEENQKQAKAKSETHNIPHLLTPKNQHRTRLAQPQVVSESFADSDKIRYNTQSLLNILSYFISKDNSLFYSYLSFPLIYAGTYFRSVAIEQEVSLYLENNIEPLIIIIRGVSIVNLLFI